MANQQIINSPSFALPSVQHSSSLKRYDVFLSFRDEDIRKSFLSHFYESLIQKKVETYIDYRLEKGDEIWQSLIKAIEESVVSVVIFSENYATSKWCLDEISKIVECKKDKGQIVIPVFYKINPSHIRKQTGSYEEAFAKHEGDLNISKERLQKWRSALTEAANLAGWDSETNNRTESEFIKEIVKDILQKLNLRYPIELKRLVGIKENYVEVESLLEISSRQVRMIGIWGMGGIGKTTLAIALHAKLSSQFEAHCFLKNVREQYSEKNGQINLRDKLFSKLLEEEKLHLDIPELESSFVRIRLRCKKVFIVFDDVATLEQLEGLIGDYKCLGPGSRVIVTTRNKHILCHVDGTYQVKELNDNDSLQLFCLNAFREKHPKSGFEELSESVIAYCKGNPLALKVLGAHLYSRSEESWKSELRKLQKIQDDKIHTVLKLSFDDLDCTEQDIFLDIACFLKGESKDEVTSLLEACGFFPTIGIEVLIDKSLINISNDGKIEMHDLIQEMGRNIVHQESSKEPGRRSRLWDPKEVYDVLKDNKGTEAIEGIILDVSKIEDLHLTANSFAEMTNIRFLKFYSQKWSDKCHIYLPNGLKSLSNKLRYLQWNGYYLEYLPSTFCPKLLVKLSMPHSNLGKLWDGVQDLVNLKEINLDFSKHLVELPDLSMATNLDALSLRRCESLRQVHPSILSLHKLQFLDLEGCTEIESLQTDVHLESLRYLSLKKCSSLKDFSVSSKELFALWLEGTAIKKLPSSIWQSENLNQIHLRGCDNLDNLGNKLTHDPGVGSLSCLILSECKQLNASNLCFILDGLQSLTKLYLDHCYNLQALPDSIGLLSSLEYLNLSGSNVEILSPNIQNLLMLKELRLDNCKKLMSLPKLPPSLKMLAAYKCTQLINASNICLDGLWSLTWLELENCYNLQELPDNIGLLSSLQILDLRGTKVEILSPNIKNLLMLEMLKLDNCKKLVSLPELPSSLRILRLSNCTQLNASNICFDGLQSLTSLNLNNCCNLGALPDNIGLLSSLEYLNLSGSNVEILPPNIKNLLMLKELWLDNCMKLVSLPKLPHSLQVLSALNCTSLEIDFSQLPVIEHNISFSLKHGIKECCQYVFLPAPQVPNSFSFCAKEASITIPHLPQSDLCGFIFCLILSQSLPNGKYKSVECSISIYSKSIGNKKIILDYQNLISDHMLFWYIDINEGGKNSLHRKIQNSEVCDPYSMSFEFSLEYKGGEWSRKGMIKGCGVHPVYATEHGCSSKQHDLKLEFKCSSKDFVEIEPNSSKDINELQPRAFGFGIEGSNHHNEDDETKKSQEVTHQIITTGMQNENSLYHYFIASKSSKVQEEGEKEDLESEAEENKSKKRKLKTLKTNLALLTHFFKSSEEEK